MTSQQDLLDQIATKYQVSLEELDEAMGTPLALEIPLESLREAIFTYETVSSTSVRRVALRKVRELLQKTRGGDITTPQKAVEIYLLAKKWCVPEARDIALRRLAEIG